MHLQGVAVAVLWAVLGLEVVDVTVGALAHPVVECRDPAKSGTGYETSAHPLPLQTPYRRHGTITSHRPGGSPPG